MIRRLDVLDVEKEQSRESERSRKLKPSVPLIILVNMRSLANKKDEFGTLTRPHLDVLNSSIMCFIEM